VAVEVAAQQNCDPTRAWSSTITAVPSANKPLLLLLLVQMML
jgi:hypothetical protein